MQASPELLELTEDECWSHVKGARLGRVAMVVGGRPHVFPVNYAVHEGWIVFRTGPGTKLSRGPGSSCCFEVDGYDQHSLEGWSVMAFGRLEDITEATDEAAAGLRETHVQPVAPGPKAHWMAMKVEDMTGRHFSGGWIIPGSFLG
jgi:nitroimidazol reductase NimA-like FMN-containing flavoprotein (pyridoxamine 5'-phosphate oxidase superfamily)